MTDSELLEAAAKAAGYLGRVGSAYDGTLAFCIHAQDGQFMCHWNPLADDGDEALLESKLQLHVEWQPAMQKVYVGSSEIGYNEPYGKDRQAARRRAGVRAAAAMAKGLS